MATNVAPSVREVIVYLRDLHDRITDALESTDGGATFRRDTWERSEGGGGECAGRHHDGDGR